MESLLLQPTEQRLASDMAYRIAELPMSFKDVQGHSPMQAFSNAVFGTAVQQMTRFQIFN